MDAPTPQPGQPMYPVVGSSSMWADLFQMLAEWRGSQPAGGGPRETSRRTKVIGINESGATMEPGRMVQLGLINDPGSTDPGVRHAAESKPIFPMGVPAWTSSMDNLAIVTREVLDGDTIPLRNGRYLPVAFTSAPGVYRYAHLDPTDPTKLKAGTGGPFRIIGNFPANVDGDIMCIVDTQDPQPLWRYRIKTDGNLSDVELQNLDGTVFASSIPLTSTEDASKYSAEDIGTCVNVGNEFYATSGKGFDCLDLCDCEGITPATANFCSDPP